MENENNIGQECDKVAIFREIANSLGDLYERKNADYGDSFGKTFKDLGIISAATRMSDKFNRFVNIAKKWRYSGDR